MTGRRAGFFAGVCLMAALAMAWPHVQVAGAGAAPPQGAQGAGGGRRGGPQTHPFLLYPRELTGPAEDIFTSPAMYRVLKGWLTEVGQ